MLTVDRRCTFPQCGHKKGAYRMVGSCWNCKAEPILMLFTEGHESSRGTCPTCGCDQVRAERLATDDEIPEA